jgi:N-formylglutamate amidohydrolase
MELKRLEVYQKEYRESLSATIEKADAKYEENLFGLVHSIGGKWPGY